MPRPKGLFEKSPFGILKNFYITSAHNSRKLGIFPRPAGGGIYGYPFLLFLSEIIL
jgi:hypothetical protein